MKSSKTKKSKKKGKKSKSSKKSEISETRQDAILEKPYITRQIETSITLLESPENNIVLESLLFLSKYADIQRNNLDFVQACGLLPKLLALFDHNICILRVALRLLSQLLTTDAAQLQLNEDRFDEHVLKICSFYVSHEDLNVREFSTLILEKYVTLGKGELLLKEERLINIMLKIIKEPETEVLLESTLELFNVLQEIEAFRKALPEQENFKLEEFIKQMPISDNIFRTILAIFEKMTYFNEDALQCHIRDGKVIEHVFDITIDPEKKNHLKTCLNIVTHSMKNENTNTYFVQSLEFLKFCLWVKTCPEEVIQMCANIFLELSKIDSIRQMLFDLSIEDTILSFLRSNDKKCLNTTFEAISYMSKHKYCCEKIITPVVIKKIIQVLSTTGDSEDPYNETALTLLHYFCRRDARTLHMLRAYSEPSLLLNYLRLGTKILNQHLYKKLLEIINMFVTNNQLQSYILSPDLYDVILSQTQSKFDEICMRSLEIMINCLSHEDFRNYFLLNRGADIIIVKLVNTDNEKLIRMLTVFLHNSMMFEPLSNNFIHKKLLLVLKKIPSGIKYRNPLIERVINLIYNMCLPIKFFETGRLELVDKITERFYIMAGPWTEPFPFLEILELRQMSTRTTIYVIDDCVRAIQSSQCKQCYRISQQNIMSVQGSSFSIASISSTEIQNFLNYGGLSRDPYLPKYIVKVQQLVSDVKEMKEKIKIVAEFVDGLMCGPKEGGTSADKCHSFQLHLECIKEKLGTNMIPIGYLRLGFHCERALLFKTLADQVYIPATLVKGRNKLYWNEVALMRPKGRRTVLEMFVVDLMNNIGQLLPIGSRACNAYCDIQ